jgi:methionyl-tRNA formyltransferase
MKLILMGTGPFAVPSFDKLFLSGNHEIALVLTRPPAGNTAKQPLSPVHAWAENHSLSVYMPASVNSEDALARIAEEKADLAVVCDYGQILSADALSCTRLGGINLHGSLLPRHRGAAPVQWAVLCGDERTGVSVIHMTPRLDAGPIIVTRSLQVGPHENAGELEHRLSLIGVDATTEAIQKLEACKSLEEAMPLGVIQEQVAATRAPRLSKQDGQLDFRFPAKIIDRQVRGLQPWPGAYGQLDLGDNKTLRVAVIAGEEIPVPNDRTQLVQEMTQGTVLWKERVSEIASSTDYAMAVVCGEGSLYGIQQIQPAGKRTMESAEFVRGYSRNPSVHFQTPEVKNALLEKLTNLEARV